MPRHVPVINDSSCESWEGAERSRQDEGHGSDVSSGEDVPYTGRNKSRVKSTYLMPAVRSVEKTPRARSDGASPGCSSAASDSQVANLTTTEARLRNMEKTIARMEKKMDENLKTQQAVLQLLEARKEATSVTKARITVPTHIRSAVRDGFANGKDKGYSWILSRDGIIMKPYLDDNKEMTSHIETFVRGIYPDVTEALLRESILRYFQSSKEKEQREKMGKTSEFNKKMVLYQRRKRKMSSRLSALDKKKTWSDEKKSRVRKSLTMDYMSSEYEEESGDETVYTVKSLPWRSGELNGLLNELDDKASQSMSKTARRMKFRRVASSEPSTRPRPEASSSMAWTLSPAI